MTTRKDMIKDLEKAGYLLPGTLVKRFFKCRRAGCKICRRQGGHGPVYYLSIRGDDKRTHMIYVPKYCLEEVKGANEAYKRLKAGVYRLAKNDLERWQKKRSRKAS